MYTQKDQFVIPLTCTYCGNLVPIILTFSPANKSKFPELNIAELNIAEYNAPQNTILKYACHDFSGSLGTLDVASVSPDDKSGQLLPCLVHDKVKLFQVNSACQYLHELAGLVAGQDQVLVFCPAIRIQIC